MIISNGSINYEVLYNLSAGDTFMYEGRIYLVVKGTVFNTRTESCGSVYTDAMTEVPCIDLVFNEIKVFDKYTRVYPRAYQLVEAK